MVSRKGVPIYTFAYFDIITITAYIRSQFYDPSVNNRVPPTKQQ